ncbi:MAG: GxxExxY protein [Lachnospiraceae bacterium]|nr:GxxExxY protein [Lachnospiraceae bacterium]
MGKRFNVTGTCIPSEHYMVNIDSKIHAIIKDYIQMGSYFTINRARQFGKTTTLYLLEEKLKSNCIVLSLSFESADDYFESIQNLVDGLIMDISDSLCAQNIPDDIIEKWNSPVSPRFPLRTLGTRITELCKSCHRDIILIIDEVDKSSDNQIFLSFLGLLREKYLRQKTGRDTTFKSVILAGVYDIKNLKLKLHPSEESKNNSPWNIAADFLLDMSFSPEDIASMLLEYETDHHTGMDISAFSQQIYDFTSGYPYLVSRICQIIDERIAGTASYPDRKSAWTKSGFLYAIRILQKESNSLFEDMIKHLYEYPQLSTMIQNILFRGIRYTFEPNSFIINLGTMFGFLKEHNSQVIVANRIFETKLYNFFLSEEESNSASIPAGIDAAPNQFISHGMLQMDLVMRKFYEYYENICLNSSEKFLEEEGRRIFLMFLRPIINGTGNYYIEAQTRDNTRTDIIVDYLGQQFVIELKIWKGAQYHHNGQIQLAEYLEHFNQDRGYLLTFNFNKHKKPGITESICKGKKILEVIL